MVNYAPKLLITLPVYNESYILEKNVRQLHQWCEEKFSDLDWEIVIANNGSTDDTLSRARILAQELPRVAVFHTDEQGRGQVLRRLWTGYEADWYTYMDVDLSTSLESYFLLVQALRAGNHVVVSSRFHDQARVKRSLMREIMSRVYNLIARAGLGLRARDLQCGCKGVSREVVEKVVGETQDDFWFFDTELLARAVKKGFSIHEAPVEWVEARDEKRKSTVELIPTALKYLKDIWRLRRQLGE